jgi:hypothetical protein
VNGRARFDKLLESSFGVGDASVGNRSIRLFGGPGYIGLQSKFIPTYVVTDIERLIEIRCQVQDPAIPLLASFDVVDVIDGGA